MASSTPTDVPRSDTPSRLACVGVAVAAAVTYFANAARTLVGGDSPEFAALAAAGGVAHPPGYPLYVLWLRATAWLPAFSPAHRASLATAVLGVAAVVALQRACRAWGASAATTALASAIFAFSPLTFRLSTQPEVFVLNVLVAMAIVTLSAPHRPAPERDPATTVGWLGLLAGLGIANHHTIVLLAPLGLWAASAALRRSPRPARGAALGIVGLALGLAPYAYLVYAARTATPETSLWGDTSSLAGLWHHFLRGDYGTTRLAVSSAERVPLVQLGSFAARALFDLFGLPLIAALGALVAWRGSNERRPRHAAPWIAFALATLLAGPAFVMLFNLNPRGFGAQVVSRFYLLPFALMTVLGAAGLEVLVRRVPPLRRSPATLAALALPLGLVRGLLSFPSVREEARPTTEYFLGNVLATLPRNAIVVGTADDIVGGFLYRKALDVRPDVTFLSPALLLSEWYPPRVSAELGFPVVHGVTLPGDAHPTLAGGALLAQLVASERPVFLTDWYAAGLETKFPSYPIGPLIRVVASPAELPSPSALLAENDALFARFDLEPTRPPRDTWVAARTAAYARPWNVLAGAFERAGDSVTAERCRARARTFLPD